MNLTETQMGTLFDIMTEGFEMFARIERHLAVLAQYAEMLRIQATGEKVYEVGSYVVSNTANGDRCVYLYSTHPGLQYRVCTVYEERLNELPFSIQATAKVWDGEAAPSRLGAAKKGYILATPYPFKVSLLPTGGVTDAGQPVHKFSRVIGGEPPPPTPPTPAPVAAHGNGKPATPAEEHQRDVLQRQMAERKATGPQPETPPQRFTRLARETGTNEAEAGELLRFRQGDYDKAADDLQMQKDAEEFDRMRSATEAPEIAAALAKADQRQAPPEPARTTTSDPDAMLAELDRLAATAKNSAAAQTIAASVRRQVAGPNFATVLANAMSTLQKMQ